MALALHRAMERASQGKGGLSAAMARSMADAFQAYYKQSRADGQRVLVPNLPLIPKGTKMTKRDLAALKTAGQPGRVSVI